MGTAERRERERDALRARIMDAARAMFARDGFEAVSMRAIADAVEYSPAAIYLHFKDKAELFAEIVRHDFGTFAAAFEAAASVPDPVERLRELGRTYVAFAVAHPNHYRLMFMTPPGPESNQYTPEDWKRRGDPACDGYATLLDAVRHAIDRGAIAGTAADAQAVAQTFWAGVHGVASLEITMHDDPWIEWAEFGHRRDLMIDALLRGLAAKPRAARKKVRP